jgi:hypothetical protein
MDTDTNKIPDTDHTIVFTPDGEPYVHMLSMVADLADKVMLSQDANIVSDEFVSGMAFVVDFLRQQRETLTLEYKMRN